MPFGPYCLICRRSRSWSGLGSSGTAPLPPAWSWVRPGPGCGAVAAPAARWLLWPGVSCSGRRLEGAGPLPRALASSVRTGGEKKTWKSRFDFAALSARPGSQKPAQRLAGWKGGKSTPTGRGQGGSSERSGFEGIEGAVAGGETGLAACCQAWPPAGSASLRRLHPAESPVCPSLRLGAVSGRPCPPRGGRAEAGFRLGVPRPQTGAAPSPLSKRKRAVNVMYE